MNFPADDIWEGNRVTTFIKSNDKSVPVTRFAYTQK